MTLLTLFKIVLMLFHLVCFADWLIMLIIYDIALLTLFVIVRMLFQIVFIAGCLMMFIMYYITCFQDTIKT